MLLSIFLLVQKVGLVELGLWLFYNCFLIYTQAMVHQTAIPVLTVYQLFEAEHGISNNVVCATSKASDQPVHMRNLIRAFASRLSIL